MANSRTNVKLYHVSRLANESSIMAGGVSPAFSLGKLRVSWYADSSRLSWAIAHVSNNSDLSVVELRVFTVWADRLVFKKTRLPGVFTCATTLFAWAVDPAISMLRPDDLDQ